jgi:hypothetical protein
MTRERSHREPGKAFMKTICLAIGCLIAMLAAAAGGRAQAPPGPPPGCANVPISAIADDSRHGVDWTRTCFPRCGCPDDYCANPYPRPCWPPYPPWYQCVPAGDCAPDGGCGSGRGRLSWWFLPTPRALREAIWCQP